MDKTEQDLWRDFVNDPGEATFGPIYERTRALVWTLCRRVLESPDDARDGFQSTWCRLFGEVRAGGSLPGLAGAAPDWRQFIYRLALREAQNLRRRRVRRALREVAVESYPPIANNEPAPDALAARRELATQLEALVRLLPEGLRLPLQLHLFHGLAQEEVGRILNTNQSTASRRIAKGLRRLERLMRQAGLAAELRGLATLGLAGALFEPPAALSAGVVYAQVQAIMAAGGAAALAGGTTALTSGTGALAVKFSLGAWIMVHAKVLAIAGLSILSVGALIAAQQVIRSGNGGAGKPAVSAVMADSTSGGNATGTAAKAPEPDASTRRPPARPAGNLTIVGRVLDAEKKQPLAGAEVWLTKTFKVQTDRNGVFRLSGAAPGMANVTVAAKGYVERQKALNVEAGGPNTMDLALDPAMDLTIQVTDPAGAPVAGASVSGRNNLKNILDGGLVVFQQPFNLLKTDAAGRVVAHGVSRLEPLTITVNKTGFRRQEGSWEKTQRAKADQAPGGYGSMARSVDQSIQVVPGQTDGTVKYVMEAVKDFDRVVQGRIMNAAGEPITSATVRCMAESMPNLRPVTALSDEQGRYRLTFQCENDDCQLSASGMGWALAAKMNMKSGTPEKPAVVDFTLEPGHWLEGVVVGPAGQPVAQAEVSVGPRAYMIGVYETPLGIFRNVRADAAGAFRVDGLSSAPVHVSARAPLDPKAFAQGQRTRRPSVSLEQQAVNRKVRLTLSPPENYQITGRVVDRETGKPVPVYTISYEAPTVSIAPGRSGGPAVRMRGTMLGTPQSVKSPDGRFSLGITENQDQPHTLIINAEDYMMEAVEGVRPQPAATSTTAEQVIRITKGLVLRGMVMDAATKKPVEGAQVTLADMTPSRLMGMTSNRRPGYKELSAVTGTDGRFSFKEHQPGTLFVMAKGHRRVVVRPTERSIYTVGNELWVQLGPGDVVRGTVYENGAPAKTGTRIVTFETQGAAYDQTEAIAGSYSTRTDAEGKFICDDLRPGTYLMKTTWSAAEGGIGFRASSAGRIVEVKAGVPATADFGLDRGTLTFTGRLLDEAGQPINGAALRLKPVFPWTYSFFNTVVLRDAGEGANSGRFLIPFLKPGKYEVEVIRRVNTASGEETVPLPPVEITGDTERELRVPEKKDNSGRGGSQGRGLAGAGAGVPGRRATPPPSPR